MLRGIADAVIASDAEGRVVFMNPAAEGITGWSREAAAGRPMSEVFRLIDETTHRPLQWPRSEAGFLGGVLLVRRDGRMLPIEDGASPLVDEAGRRRGTVVVFRGIDDRRRAAEEGLLRANQALRALIQACPLAIIALDAEGRVTLWNPAAEQMFGWRQEEVLGRPVPTIPEDLQPEFAAGLARSLRGETHAGHETRRLRKDGSTIEVGLWTAPLRDARGEPCGRMGVVEDITGRKRAEEARTALLRRIVAAQEEERHRIARELHDQMGQHLAGLMLGLGMLRERIQSPAAAAEAQRIHDLAGRIGQEVHRIALELRPTALDDWGLQTALTNYAAEWSRRARVPVQSRFVGIDRRRLPPAVETALYRTVQEALTNVLKHSGAGRVSLIVERRADHVLAIVEDDGRGFDVESVMAAPDARGRLGLLGMQERVALVGGTLELESSPGGTSLFVRVPLAGEGEGGDRG